MPPNITPNNIHPLTAFKRNTSEFVEQMHASGDPLVLTVNGKASVVVQDADAYQKLLESAEESEAIKGIQLGLRAIDEGRHQSSKKTLDAIRRKHKIPRRSAK